MQLASLILLGLLSSCSNYASTTDPCRPHVIIPTLQIPIPYSGANGAVVPSCNVDDSDVVTMEFTPLSCGASTGWWGGCFLAANQDLSAFDAHDGAGRGVIAVKLCVKDFVPSALNLRYGSPAFASNGRTKFMPVITAEEQFAGSGCRLVYLSPQDACYSSPDRCGSASGCVTAQTTEVGSDCDDFARSQLTFVDEFCVGTQAASTMPTVVTIEKVTYYPESCICNDTSSCAAPSVCRRDGWLANSRCLDMPGGCPGVCAP